MGARISVWGSRRQRKASPTLIGTTGDVAATTNAACNPPADNTTEGDSGDTKRGGLEDATADKLTRTVPAYAAKNIASAAETRLTLPLRDENNNQLR